MLVIRQTQMQHLGEDYSARFLTRLVEHARQFFPDQSALLSDQKMQEVCAYGQTRAKSYGLRNERDICKYLNLMFVFGRDFDVDPAWPWAEHILQDPQVSGPTLRINRLYLEAKQYAGDGGGLNFEKKG